MHYDACYFVLATMNYNSFKDIMEKRHYINKKTCMLDMYGIIIFFSFFPFWLGNGLLKTQRMASILLFYSLMTFLSSEQQQKKYNPKASSSLESLLLLPTALSYYELQPPIVNALKAFLVKDTRMGYKFTWQILQNIN